MAIEPGPQWQDHPQTNSLYDAEGAWMNTSPAAGQRLDTAESQKFLRKVTGRDIPIHNIPNLSIRDHTGKAISPLGYTMEKEGLLVNPDMVGNTHKVGFLTHESGHALGAKGHGPELASRHLDIVRRHLGHKEAKSLQDHYNRLKVGYR
jgi:hypothetical protein